MSLPSSRNPVEKESHGIFSVGDMPTARIESFSDNVFAFTMTLLVLQISVPVVRGENVSAALSRGLMELIPNLLVYILSFALICVWWVAHHHLFHIIKRSDRGLLWLNNLFLLWVTFIPFPTALMGRYPYERLAVVCYGTLTTLAGASFCLVRYYSFYVARLVDERIDKGLLKGAMVRSAANPLLHSIAVLLAFVDTRVTLGLYGILPLVFFFPSPLERGRARSSRS